MEYPGNYPKALEAPLTSTTLITRELIDKALRLSRKSPRGRIILPFHKGADASVHRMLNAIQPGSYIQPHRHLHPPKSESMMVLQGAILHFIFTDNGSIRDVQSIGGKSSNLGVDNEPGIFHTFLAYEKDTVIFEVKPGPYHKSNDKDFASWAPGEEDADSKKYMESLYAIAQSMTQYQDLLKYQNLNDNST